MFRQIKIKEIFRINDWWKSKAALLMGMVYLFAAWFTIPFEKFISLALLSITTISGFASLGYLFNDFFDLKKDAIAGKRNFLAGKSIAFGLVLFLLAASFLLFPWKFLPFNSNSGLLIAAELALFILYSAPPIRLKERDLWGVFADAFYAHALPVVLAAYTFSLAAKTELSLLPMILLWSWQMLSGVRNILVHQFEDRQKDAVSGTRNKMAFITDSRFFRLVAFIIVAELIAAIAFIIVLSLQIPLLTICTILIITMSTFAFRLFRSGGVKEMQQSTWRYFPNNLFEKWLPVSYLIVLSFMDIRFVGLLILHLAIFNFGFYKRIADTLRAPLLEAFYKTYYFIRNILAMALNYAIYYCFMIFGVDLKKENLSALDYLKKKRGRNK